MNLPKLTDADVAGKRVLVRLDLDVPENDDSRLEVSKETILYLCEKRAKVVLIGHKDEPHGVVSQSLSLRNVAERLSKIIDRKVEFGEGKGEVLMLENLRFDNREEENDESFARELASRGEIYANEAFATSHRSHTSIVGIPKFLSHAAGFRFVKEIENLSKVIANPKRPVLVLISGIKEDKVQMAKELTNIADKVLVGGKLPVYFGDTNPNPEKMVIAKLIADGMDITPNSISNFKNEIENAGTIVLAGVLGKYEEEGHRQGTKEVFEAVANSSAYKIAGGGDTEAAINIFRLRSGFDWISVGGGAMVDFLINKTLPGIEALLH